MALKSTIKSQNLSILLTDMQGYTDASSFSSREEIIQLIRRHNQLMLPIVDFYGGKVVKSIGDALLCTFESATDAVVCAIVIQIMLKEFNAKAEEAKRLSLRVVINTGDVSLEKNDIFGEAVNVTARMEGLPCFPGGSIGISEATYLLMNRNEIVAEKIGPQTLKGIPEPVTVYSIPLEKQKLDRLPARLLQLVEKVVSSDGTEASFGAMMKEFSGQVRGFLDEKRLGDGVARLGETAAKVGANIGQSVGSNLGQAQKKVTAALTQKTVLETKGRQGLSDAPLPARVKSFAVDLAILAVVCVVLVYGWKMAAWAVWGTDCVLIDKNLTYKANEAMRDQGWKVATIGGQSYYLRPKGAAETLLGLLFGFPVLFVYAYFFLFWMARGATPGQAAAGTAVVDASGDKPGMVVSAKRAAIFLACVAPLGLGCLPLLSGNPAPYDSACDTRVVA